MNAEPETLITPRTITPKIAVCTSQTRKPRLVFLVKTDKDYITYVQRVTSSELIGKVMSMLMMIPFIANAIGMVIYGVLFEQFESLPWVVIFVSVFLSVVVAIISRKYFKGA